MGIAPVVFASGSPDWRPWRLEHCRTVAMSDQDQTETRLEYAKLKQEHTDFDAAINAMMVAKQ